MSCKLCKIVNSIDKVKICDQKLLHVKVPDMISRVPKTLEDLSHWKGMHVTCNYHLNTVNNYYPSGCCSSKIIIQKQE